MQVEVGKVYEGVVKNITRYGAFVAFQDENDEPVTGMVHISEISRQYVNEIRDFVTEGQQVRAKCIGINPQGKVSLSMKQLEEKAPEKRRPDTRGVRGEKPAGEGRGERPAEQSSRPRERYGGRRAGTYDSKRRERDGPMSFEDMLSKFKQNSEERMVDIKRIRDRKNHSRRK